MTTVKTLQINTYHIETIQKAITLLGFSTSNKLKRFIFFLLKDMNDLVTRASLPGFMELFDFLAVFSGPKLFLVLAMLSSDRVRMFLSFSYDVKGEL